MPLGATPAGGGVQFAVFSRHATKMFLLIFARPEDGDPEWEYEFDGNKNRTGDVWHVFVEGLHPGTFYLFKADGPYDPSKGHRFNKNKALLDPYAKALTGDFQWNLAHARGYDSKSKSLDLSFSKEKNAAFMPKCIVIGDDFDWQGDKPLNYPMRYSVIYETHVRGFTMHRSSGVQHKGTYRGVLEKIPYLKDLGVTGIEFLPIQEYDEFDNDRVNPKTGARLHNYWGYSTVSFFAPKGSYSSSGASGEQVTEFKEMVRELHKAGIEVILDIVFNHTAEGNELGPTLCYRGLDNRIYYILDDDKRYYRNYSGCGNTLNCNHPMVRNLIIDCLHYWVVEMHVDGFRFDLGSILGRDQRGNLMENPPILEMIAEDPILRHTKIIAEAWDAAGAYQVGWFPGGRWAEWNDRFRNDVRRYWNGIPGMARHLATRITGSSDLYLRDGRKPFHSINFITSHDGFTLRDLVSYNVKHNEENGEANQDGSDFNLSSNCGFEGDTDDPAIMSLRLRLIKNLLATLFLSLGTPMLLGGDEFMRTQKGNNNAYCQNNEISWYNWDFLRTNEEVFRFCSQIIAFRQQHPAFHRPEFFTGKDANYNAMPDITWFDQKGSPPDWGFLQHTLAMRIDGSKAEIQADRDDNDFFMMWNSSGTEVGFVVCPPTPGRKWRVAVDTSQVPPLDIPEKGKEPILLVPDRYLVNSRSMVLLIC